MTDIKLTIDEFRTRYYYSKELKVLAKEIGVKNISRYRKDELEKIIEEYLLFGTLPKETKKVKNNSIPKDSDTPLNEKRVIKRYTNDKKTKDFVLACAKKKNPQFKKQSGSSYWLNRWREEQIRNGIEITYGDLIDKYIELNEPKAKKKQIPSTKMNNFIQDFVSNELNSTREVAMKEWQKLKTLPIEKTYTAWKKYHNEKPHKYNSCE